MNFITFYQFGEKIGADLMYDGRQCIRVKMADGQELTIYMDGSIRVGDDLMESIPSVLHDMNADLKYVDKHKGKNDSDLEGLLAGLQRIEKRARVQIEEIEFALKSGKLLPKTRPRG